MRKRFVLTGMGIAALICAGMLTVSLAAGADPGSSADPIVSKSYVDEQIASLLAVLNNTNGNSGTVSGGDSFQTVSLAKGQTLVGGEGTEIILRSGEAVGYVSGENGLANVTSGGDVKQNGKVGLNNLLIVPRDDGRGVTATTDAWFMVKGSYSIQ